MLNIPPENILTQLPGWICWKDINSVYQGSNLNAAMVVGFSSIDKMVNITDFDTLCPVAEYREFFIAQDQEVIKNKRSFSYVEMHRYADDRFHPIISNKAPLFDEQKRVIGVLCSCSEINNQNLIRLGNVLAQKEIETKSFYSYKLGGYDLDIPLTNRETDCLFYLLRGKTAKHIARYLGISYRTVEHYLDSIRYKLGCQDRSQIFDKAFELGLLNVIPLNFLKNQTSKIIDEDN